MPKPPARGDLRPAAEADSPSSALIVRRFGRRRSDRRVRAIAGVAVVLVLLLAGVPTSAAQTTPPVPRRAFSEAARADPAPLRSTVAPASAGPRPAALCLLGIGAGCAGGFGSIAAPIAPPISGPSSWTNITPPKGLASPSARTQPAMTYDPAAHAVLLFGGLTPSPTTPGTPEQDTWTFASGNWTEVIPASSCTPATCPAARAGAMVAYAPFEHGVVLFGGYVPESNGTLRAFDDTWVFANGTWTNITKSAGPAPSARLLGSFAWDALDGYDLLFGGSLASGASLGDTWSFNRTWHDLSAAEGATVPVPRAGAALASTPDGYLMLYGGEDNGSVVTDYGGCGYSSVAWWFYEGAWVRMGIEPCIFEPRGASAVNGSYPPCGRVEPALGWSPQNERLILFGGYGPLDEATCTGSLGLLNDTWSYLDPLGTGFNWGNATDPGDPAVREGMGYASDLTDRAFEIFGGEGAGGAGYADTWRFFELVHASLTGPSDLNTGAPSLFLWPFAPTGFGGSGHLSYWFSIVGLRTGHSLTGPGCTNLTGGRNSTLPYDGTAEVPCNATAASYNVYRLTVHVWDQKDPTDAAVANWTFTVSPPELVAVYSQYVGDFYSGVSFSDYLGIVATVAGAPASSLNLTIDGVTYYPSVMSGKPDWWNFSINTQSLSPGANVVFVSAGFAENWTVNATTTLNVVESPTWLLDIFLFPTISQTLSPTGTGPYNLSYTLYENWQWSLNKALAFALPIPLATGNYSLIPGLRVTFSASSTGQLHLTGGLSLATPKIALGPVNLVLTAVVSLNGSFSFSSLGGHVEGITWDQAVAQLSVVAAANASVPIWGFSILGVTIGFTLVISVAPSVALNLLLAPTDQGADEVVPGIAVAVEQFFGSVRLALSLAVQFGIGFASVAIGGGLSVALELADTSGPSIADGWVNGSIFVKASALFWSDTWNLVSGTIYSWTDPSDRPLVPALSGAGAYNNGTGTNWTLASRYYAGPAYDTLAWDPNASSGTAIPDIYPETEVATAPTPTGATVWYTDDDLQAPVRSGLEVHGLALDDASNALSSAPPPSDPGYEITAPQATAVANGQVYVIWSALPDAETALASPVDLTDLEVHGASYDPATGTWGPVQRWSSGGLAQSYLVGADPGRVAVLESSSFLPGPNAPERLVTLNLSTGATITNVSVVGLAALVALEPGDGTALVRGVDGNYSLVDLATGANTSLASDGPAGSYLVGAAGVAGSSADLALLYRSANTSELVLFDASAGAPLASLALGPGAVEPEGLAQGAKVLLFVRDAQGVEGWSVAAGAFTNLSTDPVGGVTSYGVAPFSGGVVLDLLTSSGNASQPTVALLLEEIDAGLVPPATSAAAPASTSGTSLWTAEVLLALEAAAVVLLLAGVAWRTRRPATPRPPPGATGETAGPPPPGVGSP